MGKWVLYQNNRSFLSLLHLNLLSGLRHDCGELRADTPVPMVIEWILGQDASRPGDLLVLPCGSVLSVSVSKEARA